MSDKDKNNVKGVRNDGPKEPIKPIPETPVRDDLSITPTKGERNPPKK